MILIAGGTGDPNMAVLAERLAQRGIGFHDLLIGPDGGPDLRLDIGRNSLTLDGRPVRPTGCFIRHDVFLYQTDDFALAQARALNWYQTIRGWVAAQPDVRQFNRRSYLRENNKIENLLIAQEIGLAIPPTQVLTDFAGLTDPGALIHKPVAGGEYTGLVADLTGGVHYPRFVQPRLNRPEMRIYRIGTALLGFWLTSPDLDYRSAQTADLSVAEVPPDLGAALVRLCDRLDLDFAAADFMADDTGSLLFLEVNTQPMFAAFDRISGGRVSDAIIDHLSGG